MLERPELSPGMLLKPNDTHPFISDYLTSVRQAVCLEWKHYGDLSDRYTLNIDIKKEDTAHRRYLDFLVSHYKTKSTSRIAPDIISRQDILSGLDTYFSRNTHSEELFRTIEREMLKETQEYKKLYNELEFLIGEPLFVPFSQNKHFIKQMPIIPSL